MQDVVELESDGERLALEEALGQLSVPDQFVGVHRRVAVAAAARHIEIGRQLHAPRQLCGGVESVGEVPRILITLRLELVATKGIAHVAVQLHLQPVVAIAGAEAFAEVCLVDGILQDLAVAVGVEIADAVRIASRCARVEVEGAEGVECGIEHELSACVPVAVDVVARRRASARQGVVVDLARRGVAGGREAQVGKQELLMTLEVVVVAQVEVLRKRRLQVLITY